MAKPAGLLIPAKYFDEIRMLPAAEAGKLFHAFLNCVDDYLDFTEGMGCAEDFFSVADDSEESDAPDLSPTACILYRLCSGEIRRNLALYQARQCTSRWERR